MPDSKVDILTVKVIPRAAQNEVTERNGKVVVRVTAAPTDGRANQAVMELIAHYYGVAKSRVRIIRGARSRRKMIHVSRPEP